MVRTDCSPRPPLSLNLEHTDAAGGAQRVLWVGRAMIGVLSVVLLVLLGRVAQLQMQPGPRIAALRDSQRSTHELLGRRGTLLDRRGRVLASTRVARRLFVDPSLLPDLDAFPYFANQHLGLDPAAVAKAISARPDSRYIVLEPRLDPDRLDALQDIRLPGLATEPLLVRDYPQASLAGQVIGFVGVDGEGLEGLERAFDARLRPQPGHLRYLRDAQRRPLWVQADAYRPQDDGQSIRLALDITLQAIAEQELAHTVTAYGAESGQIVVMNPYTGEILAMANYPAFDPDTFRQSQPEDRRNRAVTDVFEPGSIFKPFVWAAATQLGAAYPSEVIDIPASGVYVFPKGRRLRDASGHGDLTWDEVLIKSSNIGMAIVADRLGEEKLHDIVRAFGFGASTGSGLPGEVAGIVNPLKQWNHYSVTSVPMGHEISVTALQITRAFCAIANGGLLVTPAILAVDPADPATAPVQHRVLLPEVADHTREVLRRTVDGDDPARGTGRKADSKLYAVFGKTGTAQLPDFVNGGYFQDQYVASFIGGAPADAPRLVVGCFIQKPDKAKGHYGGVVAAPAVMRVIEQSLLYLGVPPRTTPPPPAPRLVLDR